MKKTCSANSNRKRLEWLYNKRQTDFKTKFVAGDKEHCITIKESANQEYMTVTNTYAPNKTPKMHEVKTVRIEGVNRQFDKHRGRLQ